MLFHTKRLFTGFGDGLGLEPLVARPLPEPLGRPLFLPVPLTGGATTVASVFVKSDPSTEPNSGSP